MATKTYSATDDFYQQNTSSWYAPNGGTILFAGNTNSGNKYRALIEFPQGSMPAEGRAKALKLKVYRKSGSGTNGNKTLYVQIGHSKTTSDITLVGSAVSYTMTSGENAWYTIDLTSIAKHLSPTNRFICIYGSAAGSYCGLGTKDVSGNAAQIEVTTGADMQVQVNGAWKNVDEVQVNVNGAWKTLDTLQVDVNDAWKNS